MPGGHVGRGLGSEVVELDRRDTVVDAVDDTFRDLRRRSEDGEQCRPRARGAAVNAALTSIGSTWFMSSP